jgi:hypothetical protein
VSPSSPDAAPAAPLRQLLHDALEDAHFVGHVEAAGDGSALKAILYSHRAPFTESLEANDWLSKAGVFATATLNEGHYVVITLPTAASVHQLITSLLTPWITAHTVAKQLVDLLETRGVISDVAVGTSSLALCLCDDELGSVVRLAGMLGAPGIDSGLVLLRKRGMRRLTERIQWLITGVVGSAARAVTEPGCAHQQDSLTLHLTIDQARRLVGRLETSPLPSQDRSPATGAA